MPSISVQRIIRFLIVLMGIIAGILAFYFLSSITYPFLFAWLIAFLMNPIVNFLQGKAKFPRPLASFVVLILIIGAIASLLVLLIAELVSVIEYLAKTLPEHVNNIVQYMETWMTEKMIPFFRHISNLFEELNEEQQQTIITNIQNLGNKLATSAVSLLQSILSAIPGVISWFPNAAAVFLFTLLGAYFISKDWYRLKGLVFRILPKPMSDSGLRVYFDLRKALFGFIRAQLLLISITAVIVFFGLLVLRVKYPLALSFFIGFIDLLPYLGTGTVFIPWAIYELILQNYRLAIGLVVLYTVIVVQRQLMEPKLVSTNIGLHPLATLVSIFAGLKLFGFLGLIIGPLLAVLITTLYRTRVFHDIWNYIKG
jgi:sporulation integral membrane protein YtvI